MRVLVLSHGKEITLGWLLDALTEIDADHTVVDLSLGDAAPTEGYGKVIVLGGHMGAYQEDEYPWLLAEKDFIKLTLERQTPLLGVCLGAQLIADVAGGRAYRADTTEAGFIELQSTSAGQGDATVAAISGPVVAWHHDTFDLPDGADLLATTGEFPHAFRYGSALGVQFHPEVTPEMFAGWLAMEGTAELEGAGVDPETFTRRLAEDADALRAQAVKFFRTWLEE
ncbi:MAG: gamma-glutamyl-gamma-aminobutyrate hydrolase family protein [Acidimicrobiia bacterium]|nr:gamma-glutamyl-gamma-aminobutyrate hydrolase family protein [Acidimicrobiia bacterium]